MTATDKAGYGSGSRTLAFANNTGSGPREPFVMLPVAVLTNAELPMPARLLFALLIHHARLQRRGQRCQVSLDRLAEDLGCSERSVRRQVAKLVSAGLVEAVDCRPYPDLFVLKLGGGDPVEDREQPATAVRSSGHGCPVNRPPVSGSLYREREEENKTPLTPQRGETNATAQKPVEESAEAAADASTPAAVLGAWNAAAVFTLADPVSPAIVHRLEKRLLDPWWRAHWRPALAELGGDPYARGEVTGRRSDIAWFLRPDTVASILRRARGRTGPSRPPDRPPPTPAADPGKAPAVWDLPGFRMRGAS
jgi:hypothetical protein